MISILSAASKALEAPYQGVTPDSWILCINATVARDVFHSVRTNLECEIEFLAELAVRDPVLAGKIIQAANSACYGRRAPVRGILGAITYIGPQDTRRLLMTLVLQQMFASAKLMRMWRHSVHVVAYCERLAREKGLMPPDEALLLWLLHDVGMLAIQTQSRTALEAQARRSAGGSCRSCAVLLTMSGPPRNTLPGFTAEHAVTFQGLELQTKSFVAAAVCDFEEKSPEQARAAGNLGDRPLIVLTIVTSVKWRPPKLRTFSSCLVFRWRLYSLIVPRNSCD